MLSGSGTAAVEAMMASMLDPRARVLVIENGVYGERMTKMAGLCMGIDHATLSLAWGEPIAPATLAERLSAGDSRMSRWSTMRPPPAGSTIST